MVLLDIRLPLLALCALLPAMSLGGGLPAPDHFYPYGTDVGDTVLPTSDDEGSDRISLSTQFALYGACMNGLWVSIVTLNNGIKICINVIMIYFQ